jgi:Fe2+ transport system protein B
LAERSDGRERPSEGHLDPNPTQELIMAVEHLVQSQNQEAQDRRDERDLRRHEIDSNKEVALTSIQAQKEYHSQYFSKYNEHLIHKYWFAGIIAIAVMIFFGFCIWMGAEEIVVDLAKIGSGLLVGVFGGYFWGKTNKGAQPSGAPSEER